LPPFHHSPRAEKLNDRDVITITAHVKDKDIKVLQVMDHATITAEMKTGSAVGIGKTLPDHERA